MHAYNFGKFSCVWLGFPASLAWGILLVFVYCSNAVIYPCIRNVCVLRTLGHMVTNFPNIVALTVMCVSVEFFFNYFTRFGIVVVVVVVVVATTEIFDFIPFAW